MSTFIDRLETEFVHACETPVAPRPSRTAAVHRLPGPTRLRVLAALGVTAAIAAPAIAIGLGSLVRDFTGQPVSSVADAPPADQLALLGILRDPPPGARVDPATVRFLSGDHGVRTNYVRLLPSAPGFPRQLLYTVTSGELGVEQFHPAAGEANKNLICLEQYQKYDTGGGNCLDTRALTSGRWLESAGLDGYGLVPDGVASVVLHYGDHPNQTETVTENTFSYHGYAAPDGPITNGGGQPSPGPTPEAPASITWLNAHGDVIFTHSNSNVAAAARPRR